MFFFEKMKRIEFEKINADEQFENLSKILDLNQAPPEKIR